MVSQTLKLGRSDDWEPEGGRGSGDGVEREKKQRKEIAYLHHQGIIAIDDLNSPHTIVLGNIGVRSVLLGGRLHPSASRIE
jgi:hypothetical protein